MSNRPTIAGVVLTLNEESNLPRCLASLRWCDELLVLDSGSVDKTNEIAAIYGARFIQHIQKPPFLISEQRNWAIQQCNLKSDWILFLDADEEIGERLKGEICMLISGDAPSLAYEMTPRYWFLGKWLKRTQGYPNWHPRLFKRGPTLFEGGVWESFTSAGPVGRIYTPYEHYAFSKGLDDWLQRHIRYADWDSTEIIDYHASLGKSPIKTARFKYMRKITYQYWWIRPVARFTQKYLLQAGFLEGIQGLLFALLMFFYELMVIIKVIEKQRKGLDLSL